MRTALLAPLIFLAMFVLAAACLGERTACAQEEEIVSVIPWSDGERAEYVLLDREDGQECGRGTLSVVGQDGQFALSLSFESEGNTDEAVVLVDAETLKPVTVRRERFIDGERALIEGEYDAVEEVLTIVEFSEDDEERIVPLRLEENYFDNESSLFLWRTIPFSEGYHASYRTVLASQNTQHDVNLIVIGIEQVTVPAGTFDAWRVEISAAGRSQIAWFADTPERELVQYDNSFQLFQLIGFETE